MRRITTRTASTKLKRWLTNFEMTARQHHYVPQCYLKGFVRHRENPKLHVLDGKTRKAFSTHPKNVAQERDFHAVQVEGLPSDAVEAALAEFEGQLAPALQRIIDNRSLKDENDRSYLLNLIALLAVKNPNHRDVMRDFVARISKQVMAMALSTPEIWEAQVAGAKSAGYMPEDAATDYEEMRAFVAEGQYDIGLATGAHVGMELDVFNDILPLVARRKWTLLRAPQGRTGFVTSDHPVSLHWSDPEAHAGFPPGLGMPDTRLLFPVSNSLAMIGCFEGDDGEHDVPDAMIAAFNTTVIARSRRQVYARDGEFLYRELSHGKITRGAELLNDPSFGRDRRT